MAVSGAEAIMAIRMEKAHESWRKERDQRLERKKQGRRDRRKNNKRPHHRERATRARGETARSATQMAWREAIREMQQERHERDMEKVVPDPQIDFQEVFLQVPRVMGQEVVKQVPKIQVLSRSLRKLPSMCRELEEATMQVAVPTPVAVSAPTVDQQAPMIVETVTPTVYGSDYGEVGNGGWQSPPPRHEAMLDDRQSLRTPSRSPSMRLLRKYHRTAYDVRRVPRAGRVQTPTRLGAPVSAGTRARARSPPAPLLVTAAMVIQQASKIDESMETMKLPAVFP